MCYEIIGDHKRIFPNKKQKQTSHKFLGFYHSRIDFGLILPNVNQYVNAIIEANGFENVSHFIQASTCSSGGMSLIKARYGGSNMKKINNGCRLLISCMMEGIKKVNLENGIL